MISKFRTGKGIRTLGGWIQLTLYVTLSLFLTPPWASGVPGTQLVLFVSQTAIGKYAKIGTKN
jgi:hypothetical protein